jgi:hypothetical protein
MWVLWCTAPSNTLLQNVSPQNPHTLCITKDTTELHSAIVLPLVSDNKLHTHIQLNQNFTFVCLEIKENTELTGIP